MKITYDPEVDALYVLFLDDERVEVTTQRLSQVWLSTTPQMGKSWASRCSTLQSTFSGLAASGP